MDQEYVNYMKEIYSNGDSYCRTLSWYDFLGKMELLKTQKSSPLIEKRIRRVFSLLKVKPTEDSGDGFKLNAGLFSGRDNLEIKTTTLRPWNKESVFSVVQVRPWQNVDYLIVFNTINNDGSISTDVFYLTKEEMNQELNCMCAYSAHQTAESNQNNNHQEKRFSIKPNSEDHRRWVNIYKRSDLTERLISRRW